MSRILIVDDNPLNIDVLIDLLGDYELHVSLCGQDALNFLELQTVDLILLDVMMPNMDGFEVASKIQCAHGNEHIPLLFLTAEQDDESIERGFTLGALDYIVKPFRPVELRARVATHLKLVKQFRELYYSANFYYLSGARNRHSFFNEIVPYMKSDNLDKLFAVMIDIDHFKKVNDRFGHAFGDQVIRTLSSLVQNELHQGMLFARMGGEEFVVILVSENCDDALNWTEVLCKKVASYEGVYQGEKLHFSISCGLACWNESSMNVDMLLDNADRALYDAKENGRNRVIFRI